MGKYFPKQIDRYFEPFLGGGAVFFHLRHRFPQLRAHLHDNNEELINAYLVVKELPGELIERLEEHRGSFLTDQKNYYYAVRKKRNAEQTSDSRLERAARTIFLNKTDSTGSGG